MMKKILSIMTLCLTVITFNSCSDVLDIDPSDRFSPATIWSSTETADSYTIGLYATFRDNSELNVSGNAYSAPWLTDAYSDILKCTSWNQYNMNYNSALFQSSAFTSNSAGAFECWDSQYARIRRQNEFLRDAPSYGSKFGQDWVKVRIAEVRFCRAYTYYLLCRVYGGVILRLENVDGPNENNKPRSSEAECWNFIMTELQAAANDLPTSWSSENVGRATKKSAYALLSRVALYAENWKLAAEAADSTEANGGQLLMSSYADVFTSGVNNDEICFAVDFKANVLVHNYDAYVRPPSDTQWGKQVYSTFSPTNELVDSYEMSDGTSFSWTTFGSDPYANREPRFYATILYNGATWESSKIESYEGGKDGYKAYENAGAQNTTVTGYYLKKYLKDGDHSYVASSSSQYNIIIRYAEVLLNKAEGLAEENWTANRLQALVALNTVRGRVNLPAIAPNTIAEFRDALHHERMVELAGEGFRYWDLRRWKLAESVINGKNVHGCKITKVGASYSYDHNVDVDAGSKRIFLPRYYKFAIPESERSKNKACDNNEGWI